jgi:hypothetical protein
VEPPLAIGERSRNREKLMILRTPSVLAAFAATILAVLPGTPAFAAAGSHAGPVYSLTWYEGHTGLLVRQPGMTDLGGCGRADYFILDRNHAHFKETYALLLAAHMSDQPISIHVDGCHEGISRIRHVTSNR